MIFVYLTSFAWDSVSFEVLNSIYTKDKRRVYYFEFEITESDPNSFETLGYGYSKDKFRVYYRGEKLEGSDSDTFIVYEEDKYLNNGSAYDSEDRNYYYNCGELIKKK